MLSHETVWPLTEKFRDDPLDLIILATFVLQNNDRLVYFFFNTRIQVYMAYMRLNNLRFVKL